MNSTDSIRPSAEREGETDVEEQNTASAEQKADVFTPSAVIVLGDAAALTRGSNQNSVESKQTPYD